jgi:integrase
MAEQRGKRGLGSIRKLASGRYQLRYTDPNGVRQNGNVTYVTKSQAEQALGLIAHSIAAGTYFQRQAVAQGDLDPKTLTLAQLGDHWRAVRVNRNGQPLSPNTASEYERLITNTLAPFADKTLRSITRGQIEKWWASERKRAPRQANAAYKHLKTLMGYATKHRYITENPCDIEGATSYSAPDTEVPTADQVNIFIEVAQEPFNVMLALAAWGGLRKGELLELRRKDVEVEKTDGETWVWVSVSRAVIWVDKEPVVKEPKTKGSVRRVLLPASAGALLASYLKTLPLYPEALLFPKREGVNEQWGEYQLNPLWRSVRAQAGFSGRFHSLRAFAMTQYGLTGATAKEIMERGGHTNLRTAMRYQTTTGRDLDLVRRMR